MITGIYETHIQVTNLERSVTFYEKLGLKLDQIFEGKSAFFVFDKYSEHETMLGLGQVPEGESVVRRHFAFRVKLDDIYIAKYWLAERGIESRPVFGRDGSEPIVHAADPAAAIYFNDPDGNKLELYARLPGKPRTSSFTPLLSEWEKLS